MSCSNCNQTRCNCSGPTRYNGPNVDCVGLTNGTPYDAVIQQLAEYICNIEFEDGVGISEVIENGDGTITFVYTNGNTTTVNINSQLVVSNIIDNGNNTLTVLYTDGSTTTINLNPNVTVQGDDDIVVTSTTAPNGDITYTIGRPKEFFYDDHVQTLDITTDPAFITDTYFFPTPYSALTYTNTSGSTKQYLVHVSYDTTAFVNGPLNQASIANWVDGAIIKTVGVTDTIMYQSLGTTILQVSLFDGINTTNVINLSSLDSVQTVDGDPVLAAFGSSRLPRNISFSYPITLNNSEKVSLKFKGKTGNEAWLIRAQIVVQEI